MSVINTSRLLAGTATLTIDGQPYDVVSDAAYSVSTVKRETQKGQSRVEGYSEMPQEGYISATIRDNGGMTVKSFNQMTNSTVVLQLANGKTVYGAGMWNTEASEVKTQEATFSLKFESDDVTEGTI
jgi:hypothetical protein